MGIWLTIVVVFMLLALIVYALTGGADFGGGIWEFFSRGPRAEQQRQLISDAIGPVWEANHVWLIVVVVLLFTAFPPAFYAIMVALHLPLFLMLLGIVLRGASYVFRAYGMLSDATERIWSRIFAISSALTPVLLGVSLGAVLSGNVSTATDGSEFLAQNYLYAWLQPFPIAMGLLVAVLFTYLAAVYLAAESGDSLLADDFRRRALSSAVVLAVVAGVTLWLARDGAPRVWSGLNQRVWTIPFHVVTGALAVATIVLLIRRRYRFAQLCAGAHVTVMISGWAAAQLPYVIPPALTFTEAATETSVLRALAIALIVGLFLLIPAFVYLYRVFKPQLFEHR